MSARIKAVIAVLLVALAFVCGPALSKTPDGWEFVEFNQAVAIAQRSGKPLFVYFGFETCPYCEYANKHAFSSQELHKRYAAHYVLAYFDVRGAAGDMITLPGGEKLTRAQAIKHFRASPVPAWMFVTADGREVLMRRGSRTPLDSFMKFDDYVAGGAYKTEKSFGDYLAKRGLREEIPE